MASNRVKTVEYMLPNQLAQVTQLAAAGTYTNSADLTIYIPETTSRTILAARLEVIAYNYLYANSSNVLGWGLRASCDAGTTWTNAVVAATFNESDENYSYLMTADVTAEFTARFGSGASGTVRWGYYIYGTANTTGWSNVSCKLILTYEYDDTAHATRVKTVRIPIESLNGRIGTTYGEIRQGAIVNQIPQLTGAGGFLPEASVNIRQAFLELWGKTVPSATTDGVLTLRLDTAGTTYAYSTIDNTQDSSSTVRYMWDLSAETFAAAKALYAVVTGVSMIGFLGGWLTVTYEYDHASSTTILNSLFMDLDKDSNNVLASADKSMIRVEKYIEEPGTLVLKQSAIWITYQSGNTSDTFTFKAGGQTATGYTPTADGSMCGMSSIVHRIDAGGYRGAGLTLARGENVFTAEWYTGTANRIGNVSCSVILNYFSDKATAGDGVHAHSVHFPIFANNRTFSGAIQANATVVPKILEANYWLMSVMPMMYLTGMGVALDTYVVAVEKLATDTPAGGWQMLFHSTFVSVAENGCWINKGSCQSAFKRWPLDTEASRMDIEGNRTWRIYGTSKQYGLGLWVTYHSHTFTVSGTLSGYTDADGAGLTVRFFRVSDGLCIGTTTTTTGGAYTFTWYDNTENLRAVCEEDSTHVGASVAGTAT